ncbi:MAG: DUF502 domain-containing protein [Pseudomonadota bacterium]
MNKPEQTPRSENPSRLQRFRKRLSTGLLVAVPALVTFWVIEITLEIAVASGEPLARILAGFVRPIYPSLADLLLSDGLRWAVAILLMAALIYGLGTMAGEISGRKLLDRLERWVLGIPGIDLIYGGVRDLVTSIKKDEFDGSRVVLIEFPGPHMKTIGFVTRTLQDRHTGEPLAAVYVPTTPNPTSGYIEIVPSARLVWLDWTPQEAMRFVVSGGVAGPDTITFSADAPIRLPGPRHPNPVPADLAPKAMDEPLEGAMSKTGPTG